jgi:predicted TIM-barrel fold metal-dependent hydrolase
VGVLGVMNMLKTVGCGKILFSSDNVYNIPVELAKYRSLIPKAEDLEMVLYKNAVALYRLSI